jgi:hypothetical protein
MQLELAGFDAVTKAKIEMLQEYLNNTEIQSNETSKKINKLALDVFNEKMRDIGKLTRNIFETMTQQGLSFGDRMRSVFQDILFYLAKMQAIKLFTGMAEAGGGMGATAAIGKIGRSALGVPSFSSGGITPGSFSQPVPIMAHGSEMVLNPTQQGNLWSMINSGGGGGGQPVNVTVAPTFQSLDPATGQRMFEQFIASESGKRSVANAASSAIKNNIGGMRRAVQSA